MDKKGKLTSFLGCGGFLVIVLAVPILFLDQLESLFSYGDETAPEVEATFGKIRDLKDSVMSGEVLNQLSIREWTDNTGRTMEGMLISSDEKSALIRVVSNERVYRLPLERLSAADRDYIAAKSSRFDDQFFPPVPAAWPGGYDARVRVPEAVEAPSDGFKGWRTQNYHLLSTSDLSPDVVNQLALICESIHGAVQSVPLPLLWGRSREEIRIIRIYEQDEDYFAAGGIAALAGHLDLSTWEVHLRLSELSGEDMRQTYKQFSLGKRRQYDLLVHELIHQNTVGLTTSNAPAWIAEGVAEFFSAAQNTPGQFTFRNLQPLVKKHITNFPPFDGMIQLSTLRLEKLESYFDRSLLQFNLLTTKPPERSFYTYPQALILTEFFAQADGNSLRPYLEAVLTGTPHQKASELFLLRGRSYEEIEQLISSRWKSQGLEVIFEASPLLRDTDYRGEVGLDSSLSNFRRSL